MFAVIFAASTKPARSSDLLAGLGTNSFAVLDASAPYAQTATNLTLSAPFSIGQYVVGQFATIYDWSAISSFGLFMSAPGASPNVGFTVEFYDPSTNLISGFQGFASGLGITPEFVSLSPSESGTDDFGEVSLMYYSWGDGGSSSIQIEGVVPEPSTWLLFLCGGALVGFVLMRRRKRAWPDRCS
jgi:hypothetical protein